MFAAATEARAIDERAPEFEKAKLKLAWKLPEKMRIGLDAAKTTVAKQQDKSE